VWSWRPSGTGSDGSADPGEIGGHRRDVSPGQRASSTIDLSPSALLTTLASPERTSGGQLSRPWGLEVVLGWSRQLSAGCVVVGAEQRPLLVPAQRQRAEALQSLGGQRHRLGAVDDGFDQVWRQAAARLKRHFSL
jgi:hypothetical protein